MGKGLGTSCINLSNLGKFLSKHFLQLCTASCTYLDGLRPQDHTPLSSCIGFNFVPKYTSGSDAESGLRGKYLSNFVSTESGSSYIHKMLYFYQNVGIILLCTVLGFLSTCLHPQVGIGHMRVKFNIDNIFSRTM